MKMGYRKPSISKSFKASTTGRLNRKIKKATNPLYGKKGMGMLHPKRTVYNKVYGKTTTSILKKPNISSNDISKQENVVKDNRVDENKNVSSNDDSKKLLILSIIGIISGIAFASWTLIIISVIYLLYIILK